MVTEHTSNSQVERKSIRDDAEPSVSNTYHEQLKLTVLGIKVLGMKPTYLFAAYIPKNRNKRRLTCDFATVCPVFFSFISNERKTQYQLMLRVNVLLHI